MKAIDNYLNLPKATITNLDKNKSFPVMFNPTEYTFGQSSDTAIKKGAMETKGVTLDDFTVTLFFDAYEDKKDVRKLIEPLRKLIDYTVERKDTKRPPICLFSWGGFTYKGVISKFSQKFTLFLSTGLPVRAEVTVTMKNAPTDKELAKLIGAEACRKLWQVKMGERLDWIAYQTLKDPHQWRAIAQENGIEDVYSFPQPEDVNRILVIPDIYLT